MEKWLEGFPELLRISTKDLRCFDYLTTLINGTFSNRAIKHSTSPMSWRSANDFVRDASAICVVISSPGLFLRCMSVTRDANPVQGEVYLRTWFQNTTETHHLFKARTNSSIRRYIGPNKRKITTQPITGQHSPIPASHTQPLKITLSPITSFSRQKPIRSRRHWYFTYLQGIFDIAALNLTARRTILSNLSASSGTSSYLKAASSAIILISVVLVDDMVLREVACACRVVPPMKSTNFCLWAVYPIVSACLWTARSYSRAALR